MRPDGYEYDAFGEPRFFNGWGHELGGSSRGNRFLFTGREWLHDLGLYDYRHRLYHPVLGRFVQPDPLHFKAGDYNLYRYCHNDPINKTDPFGLEENSGENLRKRAEIDRLARSYDGSKQWNFDVKKDEFGKNSNKCNKFVGDVTKEAKAAIRVKDAADGKVRPPLAAEIANKTKDISNWRTLKSNETPQPGDVAAYQIEGGRRAGASGHTGIMIGDGKGGVTNISAHYDGVYTKPGQFEQNVDSVYRRYTGD